MQKLIIVLIVVLLSIAGYLLFNVFGGGEEETPPTYTELQFEPLPSTVERPTEQQLSQDMTLALVDRNGEEMVVQNFVNDGITVADELNEGRYILAGDLGYCEPEQNCPPVARVDSYLISFSFDSQFFHVTLHSEPIIETRKEAETLLMRRLGITEEELCELRATVRVPSYINEFFAGQELGFSTCPDSVALE